MTELVIIGGGRMGAALVGGLRAEGRDPAALAVVEPDAPRRAVLEAEFPGVAVVAEPVAAPDMVLAVKPGLVPEVCCTIAPLRPARVLSIAAGVTTATMEAHLPGDTVVLRAMPNTPALIGAAASALAGGARAVEADLVWAEELLGALGLVVRVGEADLDAVTGLSGSGPAYLFLFVEAFVEAGVAVGLDRDVVERLAHQTVLGAARMVTETGRTPQELRAEVTSPNGTTEAGITAAEAAGLREAVAAAVRAATARSVELGASATKL